MGFKLAELFVSIGAEDSALNRSLAAIRGRLAALGRTRFNVPGGGFAAALGLGGAGLGIKAAITGASDLAETLSKVGVTFGDQAGTVTQAADAMAKSFGIPRREFLDAASMFGLIATGMGKTKGEAAEMSTRFAKLATDASSFYNVPVDVALEKIRAGLTGESEPLKAFGVIMDEESTKLEAVRLGLARKGQALDNATKLAARAAIIERGLAAASGDLERTQSGAANQARQFWGQLQNLGDTLGTAVLPTFTKFLGLLNEVASDLATSATSGMGAWSGFFGFLDGAIETASIAYRNWGDIIERTGVMIGGSLTNVWESIQYGAGVVGAVGTFIGAEFVAAFQVMLTAAGNAKDGLVSLFQEVWDYIASGFKDPIEVKFKPLLEGLDIPDNALKLPELKLSGVEDQLRAIDDRMAAREGDRLKKAGDAAKKAAAPGAVGGPAGGRAGATGGDKAGVTDADAYARELQEGALKGAADDVQKDILAENKEQTKKLAAIADGLKGGAKAAPLALFS